MFCRFTVHETFESKFLNVKLIFIFHMRFYSFSQIEHIFLQGN